MPSADLPYIVDIDQDTCPDIVVSQALTSNGYFLLYHQICITAVEEKNTPMNFYCKVSSPITTHNIKFDVYMPSAGICELRIYNLAGELMEKTEKNLKEGKQTINCNVENLPTGTYFYKMTSGKYSGGGKFIAIL